MTTEHDHQCSTHYHARAECDCSALACECARCGNPVPGRPSDFAFCDECNDEIDRDDD